MRILVIGATGTIGRAVVAALSPGSDIRAACRVERCRLSLLPRQQTYGAGQPTTGRSPRLPGSPPLARTLTTRGSNGPYLKMKGKAPLDIDARGEFWRRRSESNRLCCHRGN